MTQTDIEQELARCRLLEQAEAHCTTREFLNGYLAAVRDMKDPQKRKVIKRAIGLTEKGDI